MSMSPKSIIQPAAAATVYPILLAISFSHLLNDTIQSLIPSIYPMVKENYQLNFAQIGIITLTFQLAASLLQPLIGLYTDKKPQPFSLATGMAISMSGLVVLAFAHHYYIVLVAVALIGIGSSVFHPEASKVAYMASGGKRGLAQSIFQVGGNAGSAIGPLLAALVIVPHGQQYILWFCLLALLAIFVLYTIGKWYTVNMHLIRPKKVAAALENKLSSKRITFAVIILLVLIFSKYFYLASMSSYFTFFLIDKFNLSIQQAQMHLFIFLGAVAAGTLLGGPLGDRFGRKYIIWFSILGAAPFTLLLPHASLLVVTLLSVVIGFILASAFSAILVYAQELLPGKIGTVSGLFFGFAFGMGGLGSALLGILADHTSVQYMFSVCAYLPLIGLITGFLPNLHTRPKQL
ncbi:MAG: MFS transporter [Chitinophagaceae bacterium]|nr:MAG: MFS transporter [Chitinophagaceae bacterium]